MLQILKMNIIKVEVDINGDIAQLAGGKKTTSKCCFLTTGEVPR